MAAVLRALAALAALRAAAVAAASTAWARRVAYEEERLLRVAPGAPDRPRPPRRRGLMRSEAPGAPRRGGALLQSLPPTPRDAGAQAPALLAGGLGQAVQTAAASSVPWLSFGASTAEVSIADYTILGCYRDQYLNRTFTEYRDVGSAQHCAAQCEGGMEYPFFARQPYKGNISCWCGMRLPAEHSNGCPNQCLRDADVIDGDVLEDVCVYTFTTIKSPPLPPTVPPPPPTTPTTTTPTTTTSTTTLPKIDCALGEWLPWGPCLASCGKGWMKRDRDVVRMPSGGGRPCEQKDREQTAECYGEFSCDPVDCTFGDWSEWGACERRCSPAKRWKTRVRHAEFNGGKPCSGLTDDFAWCTALPPCLQAANETHTAIGGADLGDDPLLPYMVSRIPRENGSSWNDGPDGELHDAEAGTPSWEVDGNIQPPKDVVEISGHWILHVNEPDALAADLEARASVRKAMAEKARIPAEFITVKVLNGAELADHAAPRGDARTQAGGPLPAPVPAEASAPTPRSMERRLHVQTPPPSTPADAPPEPPHADAPAHAALLQSAPAAGAAPAAPHEHGAPAAAPQGEDAHGGGGVAEADHGASAALGGHVDFWYRVEVENTNGAEVLRIWRALAPEEVLEIQAMILREMEEKELRYHLFGVAVTESEPLRAIAASDRLQDVDLVPDLRSGARRAAPLLLAVGRALAAKWPRSPLGR